MSDPHTFTTIISTYYRPALLKEAVEALQRQTYDNLEIILVNNGSTPETIEYLHEIEASDSRVKLVHFQENQFSWDDPLKMNDVCLNAALQVATGDYVWLQQDDDLIADDYAEKMVALFKENPECTTAAGVTIPIDIHGNIMPSGLRMGNYRPRYMPGHLMALYRARGNRTIFSAPGFIFTVKRDVLVNAGGYNRVVELSQLYGIVPFGVTGFDETAHFYYRRHEGQVNGQMSDRGFLGTGETFAMLKEWDIEGRWRVFGAPMAQEVVSSLEKEACNFAAYSFTSLLGRWRMKGAFRILRNTWNRRHFWLSLPKNARQVNWLISPFRLLAKLYIKLAFRFLPGLARLSRKLARIKERVEQ